MTNVSMKALRESLNANVAARVAFEDEKNSANTIGEQLARHFSFDFSAGETKLPDAFMKAAKAMGLESFDFINDALRAGNRFNIKALEKVRAHIDSVAAGKFTKLEKTAQKYCACVLTYMIKNKQALSKGETQVTNSVAQAMFTQSVRASYSDVDAFAKLLNMQPSTASTQASSSLRTLDALGVIEFDEGRRVIVSINWEHPLIALTADQIK